MAHGLLSGILLLVDPTSQLVRNFFLTAVTAGLRILVANSTSRQSYSQQVVPADAKEEATDVAG